MKKNLIWTILSMLICAVFASQAFCAAIIEGQIVDEINMPVTAADLKIKNTSLIAKTDAKGNYTLSFVPGSFDVIASKAGYISKSLTLNISQSTRFPAEKIVLVKIPSITLISPKKMKETIKGKWIVLEGKTDRPANVYINGQKVNVDRANHFKERLNIGFGNNNFALTASPIKFKETSLLNVVINREMYPSEQEYYKKALNVTRIPVNNFNDFAIDRDDKYLVAVEGRMQPVVYDIKDKKIVKVLSKQEDDGEGQKVSFSQDNKFIMVGKPSTIDFYNNTFDFVKSVFVDSCGGRFAIAKNKDLMVTSGNGVKIFNVDKGATAGCCCCSVDFVDLSQNGEYLLRNHPRGQSPLFVIKTAEIINESQNEFTISTKTLDAAQQSAAIFGNVESEIISGTSNGSVLLWKIDNSAVMETKSFRLPRDSRINTIALTSDNSKILIGTTTNMYIYDYPALNYLMSVNVGAVKIIAAHDNKSYFALTQDAIVQMPLEIDWKVIAEFNKLMSEDRI